MNDDTDFDEIMIQNDTTVYAPPTSSNTTHTSSVTRLYSNTARESRDTMSEKQRENNDDGPESKNGFSRTSRKDVILGVNATGDNNGRPGGNGEIIKSSAGSPMAGSSKSNDESPVIPVLGSIVKVCYFHYLGGRGK